jgi:hypothetical protein
VQKIFDRGAFAEELGVRSNAEGNVAVPPVHTEKMHELHAGLHGHCTSDDDKL